MRQLSMKFIFSPQIPFLQISSSSTRCSAFYSSTPEVCSQNAIIRIPGFKPFQPSLSFSPFQPFISINIYIPFLTQPPLSLNRPSSTQISDSSQQFRYLFQCTFLSTFFSILIVLKYSGLAYTTSVQFTRPFSTSFHWPVLTFFLTPLFVQKSHYFAQIPLSIFFSNLRFPPITNAVFLRDHYSLWLSRSSTFPALLFFLHIYEAFIIPPLSPPLHLYLHFSRKSSLTIFHIHLYLDPVLFQTMVNSFPHERLQHISHLQILKQASQRVLPFLNFLLINNGSSITNFLSLNCLFPILKINLQWFSLIFHSLRIALLVSFQFLSTLVS